MQRRSSYLAEHKGFRKMDRGSGVGEAGRRRRSRSTMPLPAALRFSALLIAFVLRGVDAAASSSVSGGDAVSPAAAADPARRGRRQLAPPSSAALAASTLLAPPGILKAAEGRGGVVGRRRPAGGPVAVGGSTRRRLDLDVGGVQGRQKDGVHRFGSSPGLAPLGSRHVGDDDVVVGRDAGRPEMTNDDEKLGTAPAPAPASSPPSTIKVALASYSTVILLSVLSNVLFDRPPITPDLARDLGASLLCAVLGYAYVTAITTLARSGVLEPRDSRKIIHTGSAPLFMMFWPLFSDGVGARFFAGVVPLINAFRLYAAGTSGSTTTSEDGDDGDGGGRSAGASSSSSPSSDLAYSVSRSGDAREALGGPFVYVLILLASTVLFWRDNMVGVMALSTMAAGDGMADIVGRRFGKTNKWPFSPDKSVAGSAAFFVSSLATSSALRAWFVRTGVISSSSLADGDGGQVLLRMAAVCAACALVELLPLGDDNWTVPGTAAVLAALLLG